MSKPKGFTVIELLTVITMIGILVAIMQPMLVNSSNKTREMLCESNLKHIGIAANIYAEDSGVYPGNLARWIRSSRTDPCSTARTARRTIIIRLPRRTPTDRRRWQAA